MKVLRKNGEIVEVNFEEQEGKKAFWHRSEEHTSETPVT